MDKHTFLKLLSHQLQHQDPLKPMDQKKFAADLAQFSQLEQMTMMNKNLEKVGGEPGQDMKFQGASFLGKEVLTSGATVEHSGENGSVNLPFFLEKPATKVMIQVFDSKGQMISQFDKNGMGDGAQSVVWDGYMNDGTRAPQDTYRFSVFAYDEGFNQFRGQTQSKGIVTGVSFENDEMVLTIDGSKRAFLRDVMSFAMPEQKANNHEQKMIALQKKAGDAYNQIENRQ